MDNWTEEHLESDEIENRNMLIMRLSSSTATWLNGAGIKLAGGYLAIMSAVISARVVLLV